MHICFTVSAMQCGGAERVVEKGVIEARLEPMIHVFINPINIY